VKPRSVRVRNILVVYYIKDTHPRATVLEHLYAFRRHANARCFYLNLAAWRIPPYLFGLQYDAIVFHYTFAGLRTMPDLLATILARIRPLRDSAALKILVPHDEHIHGDLLCSFSSDFGVSRICTAAAESEIPKIYQTLDRSAVSFERVLTGYVGERAAARVSHLAKRVGSRNVDIGYRSWDPWPCLGRHGRLKGDVGKLTKRAAEGTDLAVDISNDYDQAILGDDWYRFLLRCRYVVGCEGGVSVLDFTGSIQECTLNYLGEHEGAAFEEVEAACFPDGEGSLDYVLLSPRHLEACLTRTGQALVEGAYNGVLQPGEHYIEIKRDFSNLPAVLEAMRAEDLRVAMVERAYRDVVESERWTYRGFVDRVLAPVYEVEPIADSMSRPEGLVYWLYWVRCSTADRLLPIRWQARGLAQRIVGAQRLQALIERAKHVSARTRPQSG
jgi:hypothetical protein